MSTPDAVTTELFDMPAPPPAETLWALHIEGPDDVIAARDRAEADERAAEINAAYEQYKQRPDAGPDDPKWCAVVITWPGTATDHAEEVALGDGRWDF